MPRVFLASAAAVLLGLGPFTLTAVAEERAPLDWLLSPAAGLEAPVRAASAAPTGRSVFDGLTLEPPKPLYRAPAPVSTTPAEATIDRDTLIGTTPPRARISRRIDPRFLPRIVPIEATHAKGTIIVDTNQRFLFLVLGNGQAMRYGVGVGRPGFEWAGTHSVTRKAEWPGWTPPKAMIEREAAKGIHLPAHVPGGPDNPMGARALYLGSTLYRIHGSNQPWTIGQAVSSGCIRMRNEDVIDLYRRVGVGTKVIVV